MPLDLSSPFKKSRKISCTALFLCLCPPGDRWCDTPGFAPLLSQAPQHVGSSETRVSHLQNLLWPPVYLLSHFPCIQYVQNIVAVFGGGCSIISHSSLAFPLWWWRVFCSFFFRCGDLRELSAIHFPPALFVCLFVLIQSNGNQLGHTNAILYASIGPQLAQRAETTLAECYLANCGELVFPDRFSQ